MEEGNIKEALEIAKDINNNFNSENVIPKWESYSAVSKFRSIRRSIRRGHVDLMFGIIYPNRPFNNRKSTIGRYHNKLKQRIYGKIRGI